jgi:uncharacterized protein (TIGR02246 family)
MTAQTDIVQAQVDAYERKDAAGYAACFAQDAQVATADGTVMAQGRDAIAALYGQLFAQSPDLHVEVVNRIAVGSHVFDEEMLSGISFEGMPAEMHAAAGYEVKDGLIASVVLYM